MLLGLENNQFLLTLNCRNNPGFTRFMEKIINKKIFEN